MLCMCVPECDCHLELPHNLTRRSVQSHGELHIKGKQMTVNVCTYVENAQTIYVYLVFHHQM